MLKHAGPGTSTEIRLGSDRNGIVIEVLDHGHGTAKSVESADDRQPSDSDRQDRRSAGHGIVGMRERARLLGGTLEARPRPDGGFRVVAHLPTGGEPA